MSLLILLRWRGCVLMFLLLPLLSFKLWPQTTGLGLEDDLVTVPCLSIYSMFDCAMVNARRNL